MNDIEFKAYNEFRNLKAGDVFVFNSDVYMKALPVTDGTGMKNAINLRTGQIVMFIHDIRVEKTNAKLIIGR